MQDAEVRNEKKEVSLPAPEISGAGGSDRWAPRLTLGDRALEFGIYGALVAICIYFSIASPYFLTVSNWLNIGQAEAEIGILAAGLTVCMIAGQLDLSIGAVIALVAVTTAQLSAHGWPMAACMTVAFLAAVGVGVLNSVLVVNLGINSLIATLATGIMVTGVAYVICSGQVLVFPHPSQLSFIDHRPLGIPIPVWVLAVLYLLGWVVLQHTKYGWHIYATGGNSSATLRAGVNTPWIYRSTLIITAACAGIAGLVTTASNAAGDPTFGATDVYTVLTAVLLGGIGLTGGAGKIQRTLIGVLIIGVLLNGQILLQIQAYYQQIITGGVFVVAVVLDAVRMRRLSR